jgi:hypothetical protein
MPLQQLGVPVEPKKCRRVRVLLCDFLKSTPLFIEEKASLQKGEPYIKERSGGVKRKGKKDWQRNT